MKIAIVQEYHVVSIIDNCTEEMCQQYAQTSQAVIDISTNDPLPKVGWIFDGTKLNPPDGETLTHNGKVTKLGLRQRFTTTELLNIYSARSTIPLLDVLLDNVSVSTFVDLNRSDTIGAIYFLASKGLITMDRATAIITSPITDLERYHE